MKYSLSWLFEHIDFDIKQVNVTKLIQDITQKVTEVESFFEITPQINAFSLGTITNITNQQATLHIPSLNKEITLPTKPDMKHGDWYLLHALNENWTWAETDHVGSSKKMLLPALHINKSQLHTNAYILPEDWIIELDNKAISHRPDLWGHRGFAREIALIIGAQLKPLSEFIGNAPTSTYHESHSASLTNQYTLEIKTDRCKRLSACYIPNSNNAPSSFDMAVKLARVDIRPINALVDCTNFVMMDLGHPMHAFDAEKINQKIVVHLAQENETLITLDDQTLSLNSQDMIIADAKEALSLAGIMGGKGSAITPQTKSIIVEAGTFDAASVRLSAARHKKRTDASSRFEKSLNPEYSLLAVQRFCHLLKSIDPTSSPSTIVSIGNKQELPTFIITHQRIETILGCTITKEFILATLKGLEFVASENNHTYTITPPSFRATKDVTQPYDIIEEIGRIHGYNTITAVKPRIPAAYRPNKINERLRSLQECFAFALHMNELKSYAFFDEAFLRVINWYPTNYASVQTPVSHNWSRLCTTLVPHLLKAVADNSSTHEEVRFFEIGRRWAFDGTNLSEEKILSFIIYHEKREVSFYEGKAFIESASKSLQKELTWKPSTSTNDPWFFEHQTADIFIGQQKIGTAGLIAPSMIPHITPAPHTGSGFVCELLLDPLLQENTIPQAFIAPAHYQNIYRDISMMVPTSKTSDGLKAFIKERAPQIEAIELIDFFQKKEWVDQRGITFRFTIKNSENNLQSEEIETIMNGIRACLREDGIIIR